MRFLSTTARSWVRLQALRNLTKINGLLTLKWLQVGLFRNASKTDLDLMEVVKIPLSEVAKNKIKGGPPPV